MITEEAAAWLDETYPGWANLIDRENFDMGDPNACIGHYLGVSWDLQLSEPFSRSRDEYGTTGAFSSYTDEWQEQIERRI